MGKMITENPIKKGKGMGNMSLCYVYTQDDGTPKGAVGFWDDSWWTLGASKKMNELGIFDMYDTRDEAIKVMRDETADCGFELEISTDRIAIPQSFKDLNIVSRLNFAGHAA